MVYLSTSPESELPYFLVYVGSHYSAGGEPHKVYDVPKPCGILCGPVGDDLLHIPPYVDSHSTVPQLLSSEIPLLATLYGYIKNHKKTIKNGQARTRESEEYKKKRQLIIHLPFQMVLVMGIISGYYRSILIGLKSETDGFGASITIYSRISDIAIPVCKNDQSFKHSCYHAPVMRHAGHVHDRLVKDIK
ncbi:hypothetical protein Tco_1389683, partial [Tanacetum coccineum]